MMSMSQAGETPPTHASTWRWVLALVLGILLFVWLANTPPGVLGKADALGYAVCHRIEVRSFHVNGRPLPLCARCTGMYLGAVAGLVYQIVVGRRRTAMPPWRVIVVLAVFVAAFGVDGLNSYLQLFPHAPKLYDPQNWLRLLTGTGMGIVLAAGLYPAFNQTVWRDWDPRPAISGLRSLGVLLLIGLGIAALVLSGNPWVLYPLALVSALGILWVLSMVYLIVLLILFRRDNLFTQARELITPAIGGLILALLQIAVLDLVRYWLTGTWEGFHFG